MAKLGGKCWAIMPLAVILTLAVYSVGTTACTSLAVSAGASIDGSASVSHANDC
ncbi:MAG: hypothetical protein NUW23_07445 [Firmicutes bacterium]|nr:hypothetical protein [Bacillota bacterium]